MAEAAREVNTAALDTSLPHGMCGAMSASPDPDTARTMAEVRAGVDAVDRELVALLGRRFGYMRAAARIKDERTAVRDEGRKAQVIANAVAAGVSHRIPGAIVERLWDRLVEESIAYELDVFDAR